MRSSVFFVRERCARVLSVLLMLVILSGVSALAEVKPLLGPVEELAVLDDFTTESKAAWKTAVGSNVDCKFETGRNIPGVASSMAVVELSTKDPADHEPGHRWFSMKRGFPAGCIAKDANGIRLVMGSQPAAQWWLNLSLRVGNRTYAHVLEPTYPSRAMIEHVIAFEEFTAGTNRLSREQAVQADGIGIDSSVPNATLLIDRITTYRQQTYASWLSFASAHPQHNIFQPGESVLVTLTPGGTIPATARGFRYEVQDFYEHVAASGKLALDGAPAYKLDLTPKTHGYYELRAYWVDAAGKDLEDRSCILAEGSLPSGIATFALMPRTVAQNIELIKSLNTNAFFGLHGDFYGLADLMGLSWRFDYSLWNFVESQKPDRSHGMASWAAERIKKEAARPDYRLHIMPFGGNFGVPGWAKEKASKTPPETDWDDYLPYVRDCVAVEKHFYPHMHPRFYGVAWEVNLNMPPDNMGTPHKPTDVVELHRRARGAIKEADPDSVVLGPCPSNMNPKWMETIFAAGLLDYVDAIETHGYADSGFTPEENDYPGKIAAINESMRRHNHGKVLPIYITEAGIRGLIGSKVIHRTQAQFMTRLAIIFKGEGIRVFLPFYGIDYDRDGWWGFCFNLEVDGKNPWGTKRISPKPVVNAMATCAGVLEGARPVRRVKGLGENVWAYLFDRDGTAVLAIWSATGQEKISLRVGDVKSATVLDIMGHSSELSAQNGAVTVAVDGSPQYLVGVSPVGIP